MQVPLEGMSPRNFVTAKHANRLPWSLQCIDLCVTFQIERVCVYLEVLWYSRFYMELHNSMLCT